LTSVFVFCLPHSWKHLRQIFLISNASLLKFYNVCHKELVIHFSALLPRGDQFLLNHELNSIRFRQILLLQAGEVTAFQMTTEETCSWPGNNNFFFPGHPFQARSQNCDKRLLASSCLSVRMEQLASHSTDFQKNLYIEYFSKICWENPSFIKTGQEWKVHPLSVKFWDWFNLST
jgi:hypothetical protein